MILKHKAVIVAALIAFGLTSVLALLLHAFYHKEHFTELQSYIKTAHKLERGYIEKLPIYADYISPQKERLLRTYLLHHHLQALRGRQTFILNSEQDIQERADEGKLSALGAELEDICFFYNVPQKYRYLSPYSKKTLQELGQRFQKILQEKGVHAQVRFAVSSLVRPRDYQQRLGRRNANAALVSSHSYGESFDIFFDEFYVVLDQPYAEGNGAEAEFGRKMRRRLGFLMGQALRRQFKAVLTEAVLELQEEGKVYAILEKKQRCYHITPR